MSTFYRDLEPVSKQLTIVAGLAVVGFMAFGLALSIYRNALFEQKLQQMSDENEQLVQQIQKSRSDYDYYRSAQYKDKYAKENLGKLNRGEHVLIIQQTTEDNLTDQATITEQEKATYDAYIRELPVVEQWKLFLFHRDQLDQLKKQL